MKREPIKLEEGARFTLRLSQTSPAVVYDFEAEFPDSVQKGIATLELERGAVTLQSDGTLPEWLRASISRLLRSLWRARSVSRSTELWPRRLTRWRQGRTDSA
jgi:hypothetical protein